MTDAVWITPGYPWDDRPVTGVFYQTQARALVRHGCSVTVACPTPWAPWPLARTRRRWREYAAAPATMVDEGVSVVRPRYPAIPGEPRWAQPDRLMARAVFAARGAWDGARLIHGHSAVTGLAAWRLGRRTGLPFVLTFHGSDLNTWPDLNPDRHADLRSALSEASLVIAVSAALASRAEAIGGRDAVVMPLGSDHRPAAVAGRSRDEIRRALGIDDGRVVVLFVGNIVPAKGVRELVDAIVPLGDRFVGVLVGGGPLAGYRGDDPGGVDSLRYVGPRRHDEVADFMAAADVLVLPSFGEGLPTVIVEAGAAGLPVIASAVGGIPDLLGDDRGVVLPAVTPEAIGRALTAFEASRTQAGVMAERLRAHVLAEHDVDANAERLFAAYREIALSGRATP